MKSVPNPYRRRTIVAAIVSADALALSALLFALSRSVAVSEWMATHTTRAWVYLWGHIGSIFPWSIFEWGALLLVTVAIVCVVSCIVLLCKRAWMRAASVIMPLVATGCCILCVYYGTAGVCYNRKPLALPICANDAIAADRIADACDAFWNQYDAIAAQLETDADGVPICPYTFRELSDLLAREFARLYPQYFGTYTPRAKPVSNWWIMSNFRIAGITFVPTAEPNVNAGMPAYDRVTTMAHEMAHTHGIMREFNANTVADYVLLISDDPYLKFCGMASVAGDWFTLFLYTNQYPIYRERFSERKQPAASAMRTQSFEWWQRYDLFDEIGEFFNDLYLRLIGGQESGTGSYYDPSDADEIGTTPDGFPIFDNPQFGESARILYTLYAQ